MNGSVVNQGKESMRKISLGMDVEGLREEES